MVAIRQFVDEYRLEFNDVAFWVPYPYAELTLEQRREYATEEPVIPPFKGRGTPEEISGRLATELVGSTAQPDSAEAYRSFMAAISLGVDCSGFAYYVLDEYLKANYQLELQDHLFKARAELLKIYDHPNLVPPANLDRQTVEKYPDWVSLAQIRADWGNNPRYVVDSTTFINQGSSVAVATTALKEADLIGMMGHDGIGHHLVVVAATKSKITYAHSGGRHGRKNHYGGVEYGEIRITDPELPIEKQAWSDTFLLEAHQFEAGATRRLRVLTGKE